MKWENGSHYQEEKVNVNRIRSASDTRISSSRIYCNYEKEGIYGKKIN